MEQRGWSSTYLYRCELISSERMDTCIEEETDDKGFMMSMPHNLIVCEDFLKLPPSAPRSPRGGFVNALHPSPPLTARPSTAISPPRSSDPRQPWAGLGYGGTDPTLTRRADNHSKQGSKLPTLYIRWLQVVAARGFLAAVPGIQLLTALQSHLGISPFLLLTWVSFPDLLHPRACPPRSLREACLHVGQCVCLCVAGVVLVVVVVGGGRRGLEWPWLGEGVQRAKAAEARVRQRTTHDGLAWIHRRSTGKGA